MKNKRCSQCGHIISKHYLTIPGSARGCKVKNCKCSGFLEKEITSKKQKI